MYRSRDLSISAGEAELEHSCDEWEIGGSAEVRLMIADLQDMLRLLATGTKNWKHPNLKAEEKAEQEKWEERHREAGPEWHARHPNENPPEPSWKPSRFA